MTNTRMAIISAAILFAVPLRTALAQDLSGVLTLEQSRRIHTAVDGGLEWLLAHQNADGSFGGFQGNEEEPSSVATAYAVMAFLSRGHQPGRRRSVSQSGHRSINVRGSLARVSALAST